MCGAAQKVPEVSFDVATAFGSQAHSNLSSLQ
jgi:hypothetical protein